jgi:hypothetical protein
VETIHADMIGGAEKVTSDHLDDEALGLQVGALITSLLDGGIAVDVIPDLLKNNVVLRSHWDRTQKMINNYLQGET